MSSFKIDAIVAFDLELTCWDGEVPAGEEREIISVGLARLDMTKLSVTRKQVYLIRPTRSTISPFCTQLTGLTQEQLKRSGRPFSEVINSIRNNWAPAGRITIAWGQDGSWFQSACDRIGTRSPFAHVIDLAWLLNTIDQSKQGRALENMMAAYGLTPDGPLHDAGVDASNLARLAAEVFRTIRTSPTRPPPTRNP